MARRPVWKRVVDVVVLVFLALAATAAVIGLIHAESWLGVVFSLSFLGLFVLGLVEIVRIIRRGWTGSSHL
jgi:hypothetical protein